MPRKRSSLGRLTYDAQRKRRSRASQTIEERRAWNEVNRLRVANSRALETDEQREARKLADRLRTSRMRVSKLTQQRRADVLSKEIVPIVYDLYPSLECGHCSSQKMHNETGMCCANDKLKFPILHPAIESQLLSCELSSFSDGSVDSKNFLQNIFDSSFEMKTEGDKGLNDDFKPIIKSEFEIELNEHTNISGFATGEYHLTQFIIKLLN
ncbi:uncharacterized protein LOC126772868 [Nymphalis io]|uniref:uncharacterized protein LOC126772868 n=1 Tax=Inachis io TaxID=171585 RepID=UPI00216A0904|nr:uncharacterized protein LOC126772868 [Nymphalis io]